MMRYVATTLLALLLLPALATAQITPALNWQPGANEYIVAANLVKGTAGAKTSVEATAAYMHFVSVRTEVGVATQVFRSAAGPGSVNIGPRYEFNFPTMRYGNLFVGGDGLVNTLGSAGNDYSAVARAGYKYHVRQSSAFRVEANIQRPVGATATGGDVISLSLGYSFAAPKAPVTP